MPLKYKLDNGMRVVLWESHRSPVISAQVWVGNGSIDEERGQEGLSHFLEHLLFKGTEKFGVGEIAQKVEGAGGELNAYTSFDHTVYYVNISSAFSRVPLEVLSQMMGAPLFDPQEIENERGVILEEIKRSEDSPARKASRLLFETNYKKHPYRRPVLGFERVVEEVPVSEIVDFFNSKYTASNMVLVVTGDFQVEPMKAAIEEYFGPLAKKLPPQRQSFEEPAQTETRLELQESRFKEDIAYFAWKIPGFDHEDIPALDVLSLVLGQGESSRLRQKLRLESPLVKSISSSCYTPADQGLFAISTSLIRSRVQEAMGQILQVLEEFYSAGPLQEEVDKAIVQIGAEEIYSFETAEGLAGKVGMGEFYHGDPEYLRGYLQKVASVTRADLVRVAQKYLRPDTMSVSALLSEGAEECRPQFQNFMEAYKSTYKALQSYKAPAEAKAAIKVPTLKLGSERPELREFTLKNGIRLYHQHDPSLPVFSIKAGFRGGAYSEGELQGVSDMMSRIWASGGGEYTERDIGRVMDATSSGLSSFGGRNTNGINFGGLSQFYKITLPYFKACLAEPTFPEALLEREKFQLAEHLKARADQPQHQASIAFHRLMYGDHPYGRDVVPTEKSLGQMESSDLREFYRTVYSPKGMFVASAGSLDVEHLIAELEELPSTLHKPPEVVGMRPLQRDHYEFLEMDKEQTHIIFGYRGTKIVDPDRYALSVLQGILSGQGGRLFIELRDKNSLAYTVAPVRMEGVDGGYFGAYIACSPEKGEKSLQMMQREFERLCQEPVTAAELERSKRYLMGRHDLDLQRTGAKTSSVLFNVIYGLSPTEDQEFLERVQSVSAQDIMDLSQKLFGGHFVTTAAGRLSPWQKAL